MADIGTPQHDAESLRMIAKWLAKDGLTEPAAFLVRLAEKLPELEQDAARYRFQRANAVESAGVTAAQWDAGIDRAMAASNDAARCPRATAAVRNLLGVDNVTVTSMAASAKGGKDAD